MGAFKIFLQLFAHEHQERWSKLVLAKLRQELVLKDGVVFNNDYEGSPAAGVVKIPVRDEEVQVSDYDKANGIQGTNGSTAYENMPITKDKALNEIIDGYDANAVPDNLVADRLDSAAYSMAKQIDTDGGTTLLASATVDNEAELTKDNIYSKIVDIRKRMNKANIPNDGKRYLLVLPDAMSLILKSPEFISASSLGDEVKQTGAIGKIAGFLVIEWNDTTANLQILAGHPRFATRATEFAVNIHLQDLSGSGKYIGASAVQGRKVYDHKVLRSVAIRAIYSPGSLVIQAAQGVTAGSTMLTVSSGNSGTTYAYKKNPAERVVYGTTKATYAGTDLTSGTTEIDVKEGDIIEVANFVSNKVQNVGYYTVEAGDIKASA
ncbi:hypothetical protein [Anaerostipes butyraticus]|uniref:Uncharacterized protein n=1 Tax=Anaerostipes butyraticus TaxID=645466 RepID=A0A916QC19_9FIRM|nr:hypothetical protein [Anaerostipes butyraticus]GFO86495.1 hypothetical protein ANBU17_28420 [Anaerostipes butyraticus]